MDSGPRRDSQDLSETCSDAVYGQLPDRIYSQLRDQIIRGRLAPGSRLVEAELALRFAVSRTPVRETLARLVRDTYVVTTGSGRRTRFLVAPLLTDALTELWSIVGALEGLAIHSIATMSLDDRTTLVSDLTRLNREIEAAAAARPRDIDHLGNLMSDFHLCFMDRCAGPWLRSLYAGIRPHVQRYEWAYGAQADSTYQPSIGEHQEIIEAIAAIDPEAARKRIERHWANGAKRTVAKIGRLRTQGATGVIRTTKRQK